MLTRIQALGFRSLRYVDQALAPFQVLVGPNGSGKSAFLDVPAFLGDVLRVGPLGAIHGDARFGIPFRATGAEQLSFKRSGSTFELAVELRLPSDRVAKLKNGGDEYARYEVAVGWPSDGGPVELTAESLWIAKPAEKDLAPWQRTLFPELRKSPATILVHAPHQRRPEGWKRVAWRAPDSTTDYFHAETSEWKSPFRFGPGKSVLGNLPEDEERFPCATWVKRTLMEGVSKVALSAEALRRPSPPGSGARFATDGSNLPWVIHDLMQREPDRYARWIAHVQTSLPDVNGVRTIERPEDKFRYLVVEYENGLAAPSWTVSDGTLRLLALTLLGYLSDMRGLYLIEEPENGIHPQAIETIYRSLSSVYDAQVLCASHSPIVLGMAHPADLLCFAKDSDGGTDIVRGDEHPRLREWKGSLELGTLFAAGVLG